MSNTERLRVAYSVAEVAELVGLSRSTLYAEMSAGRLAFVKVGSRRLILRTAIDSYTSALAAEPAQAS